MPTRIAKILLITGVAIYLFFVVFNNVTDYGSNFAFVQHVLSMDTTFPGNAGMWRAITAPWMHHAFYLSIIAWEMASCGLLLYGAWRLWRVRAASAAEFARARHFAVIGLILNMLQWLVAFLAVGGEWFLMWQSTTWNAHDTAGRMFMVAGITLLFVNAPEDTVSSD